MARLIIFFLISCGGKDAFAGKSISQLKNEINSYEVNLQKISKEMASLENNLDSENSKLLSITEKKALVEKQLGSKIRDLKKFEDKVQNQKGQIKKMIQLTALASIQNESAKNQLLKLSVKKSLEEKLMESTVLLSVIDKIKEEQKKLYLSLDDYLSMEKKSSMLIASLEYKKVELGNTFSDQKTKKSTMLLELQTAVKQKKDSTPQYILPLKSFTFIPDKRKKGVSLKFEKNQKVLAPEKGSIVYAGNLGSYGNATIIEHDQEKRSVLIGDLALSVKKGDFIQKGSPVGTTKLGRKKYGMIYFEIRLKNKVQNTMALLENGRPGTR